MFIENEQRLIKENVKITGVAHSFEVSHTYVKHILENKRKVNTPKAKAIRDHLKRLVEENYHLKRQ